MMSEPPIVGTGDVSVYILKCADGSFYTGLTHATVDVRVWQHNASVFQNYTATRRPVVLVYTQLFTRAADAIAAERQIKRWSRAKKQALIDGDFDLLKELASRKVRP